MAETKAADDMEPKGRSMLDKFSALADWVEKAGEVTHENFGDLELDEPFDVRSIVVDISDLKPPHAASMTGKDMVVELEMRGITPTYFPSDDAKLLQPILDKEFITTIAKTKKKRFEEAKAAMEAGVRAKKRVALEARMREELDALSSNLDTARWANLIARDRLGDGMSFACLKVNCVSARGIAKALWGVSSGIRVLDLCHNELDDHAATYLARMLENNKILEKLELDDNSFGPKALVAFSNALRKNDTLKALSLESNLMVPPKIDANHHHHHHHHHDGGHLPSLAREMSGIKALAGALSANCTLRSLNIFRTGLNEEAGQVLFEAVLNQNRTLEVLDYGNNSISEDDVLELNRHLQRNRETRLQEIEKARRAVMEAEAAAERETEELEREAKVKERNLWLEERAERREARRKREETAAKAKELADKKERQDKEAIHLKMVRERRKIEKVGKKKKGGGKKK